MLIVAGKPVNHTGEGLFDFGKLLFKKALKSGFARKAHKAINSNLGKAAISTIKKAVNSEIGQELQKQALSTISEKVQDVSEKALNKIQLPESIKNAARSELGQQLQNKIISEVGNTVAPGSRKRARNITKTAFEKLGVAQPKKRRRKKKGKGIVYPSKLLDQFSGQGIILE